MDTLDTIARDLALAPDKFVENLIIVSAVDSDWSFSALAGLIGVSREAVRLRYMRHRDRYTASQLVSYPAPTKTEARPGGTREHAKARATQRVSRRRPTRRILGVRVTSPLMDVPVSLLTEIRELRDLTKDVRGWTPLDAPERLAIEPLKEKLEELFAHYRVPQGQVSGVLGEKRVTVETWARNHGMLGGPSPSQEAYKGVVVPRGEPLGPQLHRRLRVGGECRSGLHRLRAEDIVERRSGEQHCRLCRNERALARYYEKKVES